MGKNWVTKLTSKDDKALNAFADVGHLDKKMLKDDLEMAERRIKAFEHDGYIERKDYLNKSTKNMEQVYKLTDKGKKLISEEYDRKYFYRSSSPNHDLALAKRYFDEPEEHRKNWITESEWRDNFRNQLEELKDTNPDRWEELNNRWENGEISPPDGGFTTTTGETVAVEVVTVHYDKADREAKMEFTNELNVSLEVERG